MTEDELRAALDRIGRAKKLSDLVNIYGWCSAAHVAFKPFMEDVNAVLAAALGAGRVYWRVDLKSPLSGWHHRSVFETLEQAKAYVPVLMAGRPELMYEHRIVRVTEREEKR